MATSSGNCFICGKTAGKVATKNHVLKEHNSGSEPCYLIMAEGAYDKDYWLLFAVEKTATLTNVDGFLRKIWCECCGHLSAFRIGGRNFGKSRKLSALSVGDVLQYEYDFGSSTDIIITVVDEISCEKQRGKVRLLARNAPPEEICDRCGAPAEVINPWERYLLCEDCAGEEDEDVPFLPITNSPRCGECGYEGGLDVWEFDPEKPFPQS